MRNQKGLKMIRSTSLTAVQNALSLQPLAPKALATKIGNPGDLVSLNPQPLPPKSVASQVLKLGDEVSLNPQPLPPKDVFASVKAGFGAYSKGTAVSESDQFLAASLSLTTSIATYKGVRPGTELFAKQKVSLVNQVSLADLLKVSNQVNQLNKAEKLMEDAYKTLSDPSSNQVERLRAEDQRAQALEIRKAVAPGLSDSQQKALWVVSGKEQQAMEDAKWGVFDMLYGNPSCDSPSYQKGLQELAQANQEFHLGVQENKSLIDWITSA